MIDETFQFHRNFYQSTKHAYKWHYSVFLYVFICLINFIVRLKMLLKHVYSISGVIRISIASFLIFLLPLHVVSVRYVGCPQISRRQQKSKAQLESDRIREQLLKNLVKHAAVKRVLGKPAAVDLPASQLQKEADMFELPPEQKQSDDSLSE